MKTKALLLILTLALLLSLTGCSVSQKPAADEPAPLDITEEIELEQITLSRSPVFSAEGRKVTLNEEDTQILREALSKAEKDFGWEEGLIDSPTQCYVKIEDSGKLTEYRFTGKFMEATYLNRYLRLTEEGEDAMQQLIGRNLGVCLSESSPYRAEPDMHIVTANGDFFETRQVNLSWATIKEDGSIYSYEACVIHPLDESLKDTMPHVTFTKAEEQDPDYGMCCLYFPYSPTKVTARCWDAAFQGSPETYGDKYTAVRVNSAYQMRFKNGSYIYEVEAHFEGENYSGCILYYFSAEPTSAPQ